MDRRRLHPKLPCAIIGECDVKKDPQIPFVLPDLGTCPVRDVVTTPAHAVYPGFYSPTLGLPQLLRREPPPPAIPLDQLMELDQLSRDTAQGRLDQEYIDTELRRAEEEKAQRLEEYRLRIIKQNNTRAPENWTGLAIATQETPSPQFDLSFRDWMQRPLTAAEINKVLADFNITFGPETGINELLVERKRLRSQYYAEADLTSGGQISPLTLFVKAFQLLDFVKFRIPLPIFGINPYEWVKGLSRQGATFFITDENINPGTGAFTYINTNEIIMKTLGLHYNAPLLTYLAIVILHESRHTLVGGGKGHNCTWQDTNFAYQGSASIQYWWVVGCLIYGIKPPFDERTLRGYLWMCQGYFCEGFEVPHGEFARLDQLMDQSLKTEATPIAPTIVTPIRPGGLAYDSIVSPLKAPLNPLQQSFTEVQLRQLLRPMNNIQGRAIRESISATLGLPWEAIDLFLHIS